jgi:hypothetical protein
VEVNVPENIGLCPGPPLNDAFSTAQVVPYKVATLLANTDCATREAGEPKILNDPGGNSVWFRWTATYNGSVIIDTAGSDFDTFLALYSGTSFDTLTSIAANDDGVPRRNSRIVTSVTAGTVYSIAVDGYYFTNAGRAYSGNVVLNINPNGNDFFAGAQPLGNLSGTITGTTLLATKEAGEPDHAGNPGGHSIWYSWTAPEDGPITFDSANSGFPTLLAIYTGAIPLLAPVANHDIPSGTSRITFDALAGEKYFIAVDGRDGEAGICTLNWRPSFRLTAPNHSQNAFEFILRGHAGTRYLIENSDDLKTWIPWLHVTNVTSSLMIADALKSGSQFYRVRTE